MALSGEARWLEMCSFRRILKHNFPKVEQTAQFLNYKTAPNIILYVMKSSFLIKSLWFLAVKGLYTTLI